MVLAPEDLLRIIGLLLKWVVGMVVGVAWDEERFDWVTVAIKEPVALTTEG